MDIHNINNGVLKKVVVNGKNILESDDPVSLMRLISTGELSRIEAWQLLRCIHNNEIKCYLSNYGTLTVFTLAKNLEEFFRLYDQGVQMLREADSMSSEVEEWAANETKNIDKKKKMKIVISFKKNKANNKPSDNSTNNHNYNNRLN